ncbi:ZIP family metal transporter [Ornithinimicrobium cryptoxanthini]|uniref:ZIP family metal transporter n=1 Tax=Ornithinimicrobium cryptoxanthini TaxID=2934161 RepID=A0ABY4YGY0_9MICO|nr:ZIP family metal transporter [Ornithinimicrobium cryptoxanthini]USQ76033.1 ZIP family metal transporter [Ornithinimicrobium cryptoxanthini]
MIWAIVATALAGAATIAGGVLALHPGMRRRGALAVSLAFAAGVMIVLSVLEILPLSVTTLRESAVPRPLVWTSGAFLVGAVLVLLIDRFLPERIVRDAAHSADVATDSEARSDAAELTGSHRLMRSGLLIALVIGAHNAPEGLMTFLAMLESPELGVPLAVAIAIHNVPEGIAVAAPIYVATGRRRPALGWAAVAGLAEPIGALVGYFALRVILPPQLLVLTLALVAGMMIALSLRELIPAARRYQTHPAQSLGGLVAGAAVVWSSLALTGAW